MNPVTLEIETLQTIRNGLIKQIDTIDNRINELQNVSFKCDSCNLIFKTEAELKKHLIGKKHNDKIGVAPIKCKLCQNKFYGKDLTDHVLDGRCERSRTCKGCRIVFDSQMSKSRHKCSKKYCKETDTKRMKLKIKTKTKPPSPLPVPVAPPPSPEPVKKTKTKTKPKPKPKPSNSLFKADPIKYKLETLPDKCDNVTPSWYERLHSALNKKDIYYEDMQSESSIISNSYEDFPMYSKKDIIYYKDDDTEAFKIDYNDGKYYKLICLYKEEEEEEATIIDNLECLSTLGEKNMTEELYQSLHKHHNLEMHDFLPAEFHRKFNDNCADIRDCAYQDGEYLYYNHDGYLCRGQEQLFRFFKHHSGLIYDMEAVEENICDPDTEEEIEMLEEFEEDDE